MTPGLAPGQPWPTLSKKSGIRSSGFPALRSLDGSFLRLRFGDRDGCRFASVVIFLNGWLGWWGALETTVMESVRERSNGVFPFSN